MKPRERRFEKVISELSDHNCRMIYDEETPMSLAWFPGGTAVSIEEQLLSDHGVGFTDRQIADDFSAELRVIAEWLEEESEPPDDVEERFDQSISRRAKAIEIWEWSAIPVRYREGIVYRIIPPRDLLGTPIVRAIGAREYVAAVAQKTAEYRVSIQRAEKRLSRWRAGAIGAIVVLLFMVFL